MQKPRIGRWKDIPKTTGLLILAQRIEEALFEYSLDSYKAPSLNTHTRCLELIRACDDVIRQRLTAKSLKPIAAEVAYSIRMDSAAKALLGSHWQSMNETRWWNTDNPSQLRIQAELLRGFLRKRAYDTEIVRQLRALLPTAKDKGRILALTADLVNEWVRIGFSRHYIYYRAKAHFFSIAGPPIKDSEYFDSFLASFNPEPKEFEVVIRGSASWLPLKEAIPAEVASIAEGPLKPRTKMPKENGYFSQKHSGVYLTVPKIRALDARAAQAQAESRLQLLASVAGLHVHRQLITIDKQAVAYEGTLPIVLRPLSAAIHKEEDCDPSELPGRFGATVSAFGPSQLSSESWLRIGSSLGLHAAAIASPDNSVQLTGLWAALETLLPAPPEESKINAVVEALVPALCRYYPTKLFLDMHTTLERCVPKEYQAAVASLSKDLTPAMRCASIIALPSSEPLRDILYKGMDTNPLLRYRVFALMSKFKTGQAAYDAIRAHEQRVSWHLLRIYRARNLVVHAGIGLPYRDSILENLHFYFHELLKGVERLCSGKTPPGDLDSAILRLKLDHANHLESLKSLGITPTASANISTVVLGPDA